MKTTSSHLNTQGSGGVLETSKQYIERKITLDEFSEEMSKTVSNILSGIDGVYGCWTFFYDLLEKKTKKCYGQINDITRKIENEEIALNHTYGFNYLDYFILNKPQDKKDILITNDNDISLSEVGTNIELYKLYHKENNFGEQIKKEVDKFDSYKKQAGYISLLSMALSRKIDDFSMRALADFLALQTKEKEAFLLQSLYIIDDIFKQRNEKYYLYFINSSELNQGELIKGLIGVVSATPLKTKPLKELTVFTDEVLGSEEMKIADIRTSFGKEKGLEEGRDTIASAFRHNILTYLNFLRYATDDETRSYIIDDIRNIVEIMEHWGSYEKMERYVTYKKENHDLENVDIKGQIERIIAWYSKIFKDKEGNNVLDGFGSNLFKKLHQKTIHNEKIVEVSSNPNLSYIIESTKSLVLVIVKDIISNALKHICMDNPYVRVHLDGQLDAENKLDYIEVSVANSGKMDKEFYERFKKDVDKISLGEMLKDCTKLGIHIYKYFCHFLKWKLAINQWSVMQENNETQIKILIPINT